MTAQTDVDADASLREAEASEPFDYDRYVASLPWYKRVGHYSKRAELALYFLLLTGLLLWDTLGLRWPLERAALVAHVLGSVVLFPLVIVPFWLSHRERLAGCSAGFLRASGRWIEALFVVLMVSGVWLFLLGNRGEPVGEVAHWLHLVLSIVTGVLVLAHAWTYSMVRRLLWLLALAAGMAVALSAPALAKENAPLAATHSASLLYDAGKDRLLAVNFSAGSVTAVAQADGRRLQETVLGGDLHGLALTADGKTLAVTDFANGLVWMLEGASLKVQAKVALGGRPHGVVYDAAHRRFWVTLFEDHALVALSPTGKVLVRQEVEETPRGLALLPDGRLLVTHSMIGKVSLWQTTAQGVTPLKTLALAVSQVADEAVSQGVPRLLDEIIPSPDLSEAWLPHVLWNFDHPFQFQSTVFPAVSVLVLDAGEEHEAEADRKQLFQQINILEEGSRTRIVSNPVSAAFSDNGKRVYVTAAGSEDLLVFDRSRAAAVTKGNDERRSRRANKLDQGGAKVTQILRHLPGDNPRGIVAVGENLYVQNAMSLDLSRLSSGGDGAFARVAVAQESFARLVEKDPLPPEQRRGERLFHSANTADFPEAPMTGDNWMSCQSCHFDGFNFTNTYLFKDSPHDKFTSAVTGHAHLKTMVAGDFVGDYLRMVRDTQGGMGADTRFPTPNTDPAAPSAEVKAMMTDLHSYVTAQGNLPYLSTWMRVIGAETGALPAPSNKATVHEREWVNSAACRDCHKEMFDQWADSNHRLMGESNPYYKVVETLAGSLEGEDFRAWCMGCHQPQKLSAGWKASTDTPHMFEKGAESLRKAHAEGRVDLDEGTSCLMCHRITKLEDAGQNGGGNASYTVDLKHREQYVFEAASNEALRWLGEKQINAKPEVHKQSYSQPFYKDPKLCATCHGEFSPGVGAVIVDTYGEWLASPFNRPDDPSQNRTCIDCHMHGDVARIGQPIPGRSTDGGPLKANVVTHQFTGANHHLVGLRNDDLAQKSIQLLQAAAKLDSRLEVADGLPSLVVQVKNTGAGHALPTGVADFRELWLDVTVKDANGQIVFENGKMGPDGTVPASSRFFRKVFGREDGTPAGLAFWRHEKMLEDTRIPAGAARDERFALPEGVALPVTVEARLMFRIYPKWVTDAVRQSVPELPEPSAVEMAKVVKVLP